MIRLTLLSQAGIDYDGEPERFSVETTFGPLEVGGGYADCFELLQKDSALKVIEPLGVKAFAVHSGILEVKSGRARIICSYDEEGSQIDVGRAASSQERAEKRLSSQDPDLDWERASASLSRALSRLKAAKIASGGK